MSMKVNKVLPSPAELKEEYPLSEKLIQLKKEQDAEIRDIFTGKSDQWRSFCNAQLDRSSTDGTSVHLQNDGCNDVW